MIMVEELDPDVVRWGLHLLDICYIPSGGSPSSTIHYVNDNSRTESVREGFCEAKPNEVENDEIIAHAFQEELAKIASTEKSGSLCTEEHSQASVLSQDWQGQHSIDLGNDNHEDLDERRNFGLCSSSREECMEDWPCPPEIEAESILDGEVGKRLNDMVPIPHIPKINGEIPTPDEEVSDHQRLLDRLQVYELVELKVRGDGNCQFRALSDQIYRTSDHHRYVRQDIIDQLKLHPELYDGYVPMAYVDYLKHMSKDGQWGDHVTLQAAADAYGVKIFIITSFRDTCYIEILPQTPKSKRSMSLDLLPIVLKTSHFLKLLGRGALQLNISRRRTAYSRDEEKEKLVEILKLVATHNALLVDSVDHFVEDKLQRYNSSDVAS